MERKRKLPARSSRTENSKKRTLTPPDSRQTPTPADSPAPTAVIQEALPKKIEAGKALPTVDEPQNLETLQSKDYQSVAESGILSDSLHRSRQQWLSEGIFEKYWTKPVKKKGVTDLPANNPAKDTMTKLGQVTIIVEPHVFEAQMFAIKDNTPRPPIPQIQPQNPMYRPIIQYGPPSGSFPPPPPAPPLTIQKPIPTPQTTPQPLKSEDVHMTNSQPTPPASYAQTPNGTFTNGVGPNGSNPPSNTSSSNPPPPAAARPRQGRGTDPVIQMLAERAATDPNLKSLMRIVANGEASPAQLKNFQDHIDDLTRLQKAREVAAQAAQSPKPPHASPAQSSSQPATHVNGNTSSKLAQPPAPPAVIPFKANPVQNIPVAKSDYQQPQALRSKGPVPSKSDISGVVFEFNGGNGDRYLFPKFSILEPFGTTSQMVASFLIVRKGSRSDSPSYDADLDYYQPITIRLQFSHSKQLDALQKVVAPQEEVQRYMNDVMDKATRAEYVLLAMRLPRDNDTTNVPEKEEEDKNELSEPIVGWATTNTTLPVTLKAKPAKKVPTEEEQYQSFISSVAAGPL